MLPSRLPPPALGLHGVARNHLGTFLVQTRNQFVGVFNDQKRLIALLQRSPHEAAHAPIADKNDVMGERAGMQLRRRIHCNGLAGRMHRVNAVGQRCQKRIHKNGNDGRAQDEIALRWLSN